MLGSRLAIALVASTTFVTWRAEAQPAPAEPPVEPAVPTPVETPPPPSPTEPAPGLAPEPPAPPAPPATPPPPPAPSTPPATPPAPPAATPTSAPSTDPSDPFQLPPDDPRVPSFLRALRLGQDSLVLGGYIQPGFTYVVDTEFDDDDQDGFEFNNVRLVGRGDQVIEGKLGFGYRFNFDVNRGNFSVRDVYGTLHWDRDLLALDLGQLKTPLGAALLQSESAMQFPRSALTRELAFGRDLGLQLRSDFPVGPVWFHVAGSFGNGDFGFRQRRNIDDEYVWVGRLQVSPFGRMRGSESDLDDSDFQLAAGFSAGYTSAQGNALGLSDAGAPESRVEGDLRLWFRGFSLRGEYLRAFRGENESSPEFQRYAMVVQSGYVLPIPLTIPRFELVARWQQIDVNVDATGEEGTDYVVDNTEARLLQFGANAYVADHAVKLMFLYTLTDLLEGPAVDSEGNPLLGDKAEIFAQFGWL